MKRQAIYKVRGLGMGMLGGTTQVDGLPSGDVATAVDHLHLGALEWKKEIVRMNIKDGNVVHGDIEVVDSVRSPCQTTESGCREIVNYLKENDKVEPCMDVPCACPLWDCNFAGLLEHLSLHFSSKHQDSGRRFKYNAPLTVSLGMNETFLVLQAEEDGLLFIFNRGTKNVGDNLHWTKVVNGAFLI